MLRDVEEAVHVRAWREERPPGLLHAHRGPGLCPRPHPSPRPESLTHALALTPLTHALALSPLTHALALSALTGLALLSRRKRSVVDLLRAQESGERAVRTAEVAHRVVPNRLTRRVVEGGSGFFVGKFSADGEKYFCTGNDRRLRSVSRQSAEWAAAGHGWRRPLPPIVLCPYVCASRPNQVACLRPGPPPPPRARTPRTPPPRAP